MEGLTCGQDAAPYGVRYYKLVLQAQGSGGQTAEACVARSGETLCLILTDIGHTETSFFHDVHSMLLSRMESQGVRSSRTVRIFGKLRGMGQIYVFADEIHTH